MIAIGARPWIELTRELCRRYAARCGADFKLVDTLPSEAEFALPTLPDAPGRRHKRVYACKSWFAWKALAIDGYDRVLVLDDSCCVDCDGPDVFALTPPGHFAGTLTNPLHAAKSFAVIDDLVRDRGMPDVARDPTRYVNTGVMLYDQASRGALAPDRIIAAADLLFAIYPHQTLSYYLLANGAVPGFLLPAVFNATPAPDMTLRAKARLTSVMPLWRSDVVIYHITGAYLNRDVIIPELAWSMLNRRDPAAAAAIDWRSVPRLRQPRPDSMRQRLSRLVGKLARPTTSVRN